MEHVARDAASAHLGITAGYFARFVGRGDRMGRRKVGADQQRVDLGRVPAQDHVLVRVLEDLRLHEVAGREQFGERSGLARIVERISEKFIGTIVEVFADAGLVDIDAFLARGAKVLRQFLEPEALKLAARDIVMMREDPGVDDTAAIDVVTAISDDAFGDLESRRAGVKSAAVTAERKLHSMAAGARFEIFEVEAEKIVPLDNVGVALADDSHHLLEHRPLIHLPAREHPLESLGIGKSDRDDPVPLARRARKLEPRTDISFDIELKTAQAAEFHPHKKGRPGQHQMLLDRVGEDEVGRIGCARRFPANAPQMAARRFERVAGVETNKITKPKAARELDRLMCDAKSLEQLAVGEQGKEPERTPFADERTALTPENLDLVTRDDFDRDHPGVGGIAK